MHEATIEELESKQTAPEKTPPPPSRTALPLPPVAPSIATPPPSQETLTNETLIKLAKAGLSDEVIVGMMRSQAGQYSTTPTSVIAMKQAGVSDTVIAAMVGVRGAAAVKEGGGGQVAKPNDTKHAPLPEKLAHAKTAFLENRSGDQKLADNIYGQITDWERWAFVTDRGRADILLILTNEESFAGVMTTGSATAIGRSAYGTAIGIPLSQEYVYLHIVDRETGDVLWTAKSRVKIGAGRTAGTLVSDLKERLGRPATK
jgi:hypothetical protein